MPQPASTTTITEEEYFVRVRTLANEINSAISAIEHNDLQALQASVVAQEKLSSALSEAMHQGQPRSEAGSPLLTAARIRAEFRALSHLNRLYHAVLSRANLSTALILALYRNYGQGYAKDAPAIAERHTWSCEG